MEFKPTIISVADSTHYLVGETDIEDNFNALPQLGEVVICRSLGAAKSLLRQNNVKIAQLTWQTAYDEMCGLPKALTTNQTICI